MSSERERKVLWVLVLVMAVCSMLEACTELLTHFRAPVGAGECVCGETDD